MYFSHLIIQNNLNNTAQNYIHEHSKETHYSHYYYTRNVERRVLQPSPDLLQPTLRCERLARAATGFASVRQQPASSLPMRLLSRWLPLQHPIRTDLRPKVLLQYSIMRTLLQNVLYLTYMVSIQAKQD